MKAKYRTSTENKVLSPPTKEQSDATIRNFFKKTKNYIKPSFLDKDNFLHKKCKVNIGKLIFRCTDTFSFLTIGDANYQD